ncbi:MAG: hypothetical protein AVDCRST_MAG05-2316 [uncultured Rubrobacteraceae bacterium]|uniref:Uncharacterized protein n=1 Tax=uncultured Rubrobacteraceae bacterium TaxID=349277 RepID=A0A6J4SN74_9ACTN|nr:MAG: hypothetical protein AVDCRST_MAG05-2316 [uncultured Rubrobacteraceae bacterium]
MVSAQSEGAAQRSPSAFLAGPVFAPPWYIGEIMPYPETAPTT